jgi:nucleoside-diphosphate-sugar epimerase
MGAEPRRFDGALQPAGGFRRDVIQDRPTMSRPAARHLFCFGLGYSALALAERLQAEGWSVAGTCRTAEKQAALAARGMAAHRFEREHPLADAAAALAGTTHLLVSVPPDAAGDPVLDAHGADIAALKTLAWAGYLSTTGVYGDRGGGWVDEATPLAPSGERNRRRAAAEAGWLALQARRGVPVHVFRLAGIYGPGRNPLLALREGRARRIVKPGQVFGRIHVEDVAQVLLASMARPNPGAIYNVTDDESADPAVVIEHAAALLGVSPPPPEPFESAALTPMARSFYEDCKRVRNDRIKRELGIALRYPTYREGLAALRAAIV